MEVKDESRLIDEEMRSLRRTVEPCFSILQMKAPPWRRLRKRRLGGLDSWNGWVKHMTQKQIVREAVDTREKTLHGQVHRRLESGFVKSLNNKSACVWDDACMWMKQEVCFKTDLWGGTWLQAWETVNM